MRSYWGMVANRAFGEAATSVGFGSAERAVVTVAIQAAIALLIYLLLGETELARNEPVRLITALAPLAVLPIMFFWKIASVPARIYDEQRKEADQERLGHIFYLAHMYVNADLEPDKEKRDLIHYGLAYPPEDWLNQRLTELGFQWRVRVKPGAKVETYDA